MAIIGIVLLSIIALAINFGIVWLLTTFAILPIAEALGADLPFWPVLIVTWVVLSVLGGGVSVSTRKG